MEKRKKGLHSFVNACHRQDTPTSLHSDNDRDNFSFLIAMNKIKKKYLRDIKKEYLRGILTLLRRETIIKKKKVILQLTTVLHAL